MRTDVTESYENLTVDLPESHTVATMGKSPQFPAAKSLLEGPRHDAFRFSFPAGRFTCRKSRIQWRHRLGTGS